MLWFGDTVQCTPVTTLLSSAVWPCGLAGGLRVSLESGSAQSVQGMCAREASLPDVFFRESPRKKPMVVWMGLMGFCFPDRGSRFPTKQRLPQPC